MTHIYDSRPDRDDILVLQGEMKALRLECQHSAETQGQRIGALEQATRSQEDRLELLRSRIERLDSDMRVSQARLSTVWGAVTGSVVILEIFRML